MTERPPVKPTRTPLETVVQPGPLALALLPLLLATALFTGLALREAPLARGSAPPPVDEVCPPGPPTFAPLWDDGGVLEREQGWALMGVGAVSVTVCGPGTLTVTARGELAGDELPLLTVSLGPRPLAAFAVGEVAQEHRVAVPGAGLLSVGYPNDFYASRYRYVILRDMTCAGEALPNATLIREPVVLACAGELALTAAPGEHGEGVPQEPPRLRLSDGNAVLAERELRGEDRLRVSVAPGEVTVEVLNPYSEQLADRNLIVEALVFTPEP